MSSSDSSLSAVASPVRPKAKAAPRAGAKAKAKAKVKARARPRSTWTMPASRSSYWSMGHRVRSSGTHARHLQAGQDTMTFRGLGGDSSEVVVEKPIVENQVAYNLDYEQIHGEYTELMLSPVSAPKVGFWRQTLILSNFQTSRVTDTDTGL